MSCKLSYPARHPPFCFQGPDSYERNNQQRQVNKSFPRKMIAGTRTWSPIPESNLQIDNCRRYRSRFSYDGTSMETQMKENSFMEREKMKCPFRSFYFRSPSVAKERTRDDLIDSIIHTRTKEHRVMPGFLTASRSDKHVCNYSGNRIHCNCLSNSNNEVLKEPSCMVYIIDFL